MLARTLTFAALFLTSVVNAQVQPRDLDGDPLTVEAYYDPIANITALAHRNLGLLENFGIAPANQSDCLEGVFCGETLPGIDRFGYMEWPTADAYIGAMNGANYLGQSVWRLPSANFIYDVELARWLGGSHELENINNWRYEMYLPMSPSIEHRHVTNHFHPVEGRAYIRWNSVYSTGTYISSGLTRFAVWPILDGDVGGDVDDIVKSFCGDSDGDGFGWDGVSGCVATNYSYFTGTVNPLQPRDLDGDVATVEAYYHPQLDITWLADSRLAATLSLGFAEYINADGSFEYAYYAQQWLAALNNTQYLGYAEWRMSSAEPTHESSFFSRIYDAELDVLTGMLPQLTVGDGMGFELQPGNYYIGGVVTQGYGISEYGGRLSGRAQAPDFRTSYFAWPVHDGDIGAPLNQNAVENENTPPFNDTSDLQCVDNDGDGWGWNGVQSCRVTAADGNTVTVLTECVDTDGDGWGWDGEESCLIATE